MGKYSVGIQLRKLNNLIKRYFDKNCSCNKKLFESITGTNGWIIEYISKNSSKDIYQKDLEKEFGITRSTASKVVNLMVKKELIERQAVPQDGRLKKLVLTKKSLEIVNMMRTNGKNMEKTLTKGLSKDEINSFLKTIEKMKENLREAN